jgi:hypothetical protein
MAARNYGVSSFIFQVTRVLWGIVRTLTLLRGFLAEYRHHWQAAPFLQANLPDNYNTDVNVDIYDISSSSVPIVRFMLMDLNDCGGAAMTVSFSCVQLVYSTLSGSGENESNVSSANYKPVAIAHHANDLYLSAVVSYFGIKWQVTLHATDAFMRSQQTHTPYGFPFLCVVCVFSRGGLDNDIASLVAERRC